MASSNNRDPVVVNRRMEGPANGRELREAVGLPSYTYLHVFLSTFYTLLLLTQDIPDLVVIGL